MLKIYFLTGIRKLLKDRFYSMIIVSGLAIGLAGCLLIIFYIQDELSYDKFHEKSDQIYRICALGSIGNTPINQVYTCAPPHESLGVSVSVHTCECVTELMKNRLIIIPL